MNLVSQREYEEHLEHHGIHGMKWGHKNGPPYPLRASQKSSTEKKTLSSEKEAQQKKQNKKINYELLSKESKSIKDDTKEIVKVVSRIGKNKKDSKRPLADISDAELKRMVARLNMEKRYSELTSESTRGGFDKVTDVLSVIGSVVGIAGSAAAIYATLNK